MKKLLALGLGLAVLAGCRSAAKDITYTQISQQKAKEMMDSGDEMIILDVRTLDEYNNSHIPNALCIPLDELEKRALNELSDQSQMILVYCRSGVRSKKAADILVKLKYTNVYEFGGIITWPYEVE
ncbi:MAG: rhodanese-like domain-containing protein [Erysipelotrichaceae bacterium]|nr:rhodanese-like domain-containing protein [Erysipelotrichaceae bacterium]